MKIGFIGMGIMGKPMAINLLSKGYDVTANTRTQEKAAAVVEKGAGYCADQKQLAEQVDVLLTMLPNGPDVEKVMLENRRQGIFRDTGTRILAKMICRFHVDVVWWQFLLSSP